MEVIEVEKVNEEDVEVVVLRDDRSRFIRAVQTAGGRIVDCFEVERIKEPALDTHGDEFAFLTIWDALRVQELSVEQVRNIVS